MFACFTSFSPSVFFPAIGGFCHFFPPLFFFFLVFLALGVATAFSAPPRLCRFAGVVCRIRRYSGSRHLCVRPFILPTLRSALCPSLKFTSVPFAFLHIFLFCCSRTFRYPRYALRSFWPPRALLVLAPHPLHGRFPRPFRGVSSFSPCAAGH